MISKKVVRVIKVSPFFSLALSLFVFSLVTAGFPAEKMELKLGINVPHGNILTEENKFMAKIISEKTNGRINIKVYPLTLGGEREMLEGLQLGTLDMAAIGIGPMGNLAPEMLALSLPYVIQDWDHLEKVLKSDVTKRLNEIFLKKTGIRIFGWMEQGYRETITVKKPITRLEDFQGIKLRMTEDDILIKTFELFGAKPVVMPWSEAYTAMQTGLVGGMEPTPMGINSMKFWEVTNYLSLTSHQHTMVSSLIRESLWKKLDSETQKIFYDAAQKMLELNYSECPKMNDTAYTILVKKHKATYVPDLGPFKEAVKPLIKEWGEKTKTSALIEEIKAIK